MTKIMSFTNKWVLALLLLTFMAGCGSNSDLAPAPTPTPDPTVSSTKAISDYSFGDSTGIVDESAKTISVSMPNGTDVTALVATYTTSGEFVDVGLVEQTSGTTANDFTSPVLYTVTAVDGTVADYTVTVTAGLITDKAITSFSINGDLGIIDEAAKTIEVSLSSATTVDALVAKFTTTGTSVEVGTPPTLQKSTVTPNDFTAPVDYLVTAGDASTATYTVTVSASVAQGPATVNLGTAGDFAILAESGISATGQTFVTGDIGVSPAAGSTITGFGLVADLATNTFSTSSLVSGKVYAANDTPPTPSKMSTAVGDMHTAYTDAQTRVDPDFLNLHAGEIGGQTLVPGLYKYTTGLAISTDVTLTGGADDIWIIQIDQDLTVADGVIVTLSGGAQAKNIFWQVAGQANFGTTADFKGIILCKTQISFLTGAVLNGRALAQTAVTLNATTITEPAL